MWSSGELQGRGLSEVRAREGHTPGFGCIWRSFFGCLFVFAGCGRDESQAPVTPTQSPETSTPAGTPTENTVVGGGQAESTKDEAFKLNTTQPVPPNFEEAYGRRARLVVQFYKLDQDSLSYPQGLYVDRKVNRSMMRLSTKYPTIEFFSYGITNPGPVGDEESLQPGEYGTLAAQLGVGITPFVAMLAPSSDEYVITNLFEGYVPRARAEPGALRSRGGTGRGQHERCQRDAGPGPDHRRRRRDRVLHRAQPRAPRP